MGLLIALSLLLLSNAVWIYRFYVEQKKKAKIRSIPQEHFDAMAAFLFDLQQGGGLIRVERVDPRSVLLVPPYR